MQLEFNMEDKPELDFKLEQFQKQIDMMNDSVGKVRRKLFAEMGELKKLCSSLKIENEQLKSMIKNEEKPTWLYSSSNDLFEIKEYAQKTG